MSVLANVNLALRFLLELCALVAVGYWGWHAGAGAMRPVLALGAVAVVVVVWALFISPKATIELARPIQFGLELGVWAAAGAGLYAAGLSGAGLAFAGIAVASGSLNWAWS